jgi:hypothetical protein
MRLVRMGNGGRACRWGVVALLLAVGAGCEKKETEAEKLQRAHNAKWAEAGRRLDEKLSELEARLAKQDEALRRARGNKLSVDERLDLADAWGVEIDQLVKQTAEIKAAVENAAGIGAWTPAQQSRVRAAAERFEQLTKDWDAVLHQLDHKVQKLKPAEPPKK